MELRICCPFCGEDDFKCYVNPEARLVNCFKCSEKNKRRDCYDFVAATEHISRQQAILRLLAEYKDVTPDEFDSVEKPKLEKPLAKLKVAKLPDNAKRLFSSWPQVTVNADEEAYYQYLRQDRGLTDQEIYDLQTHCVELLGRRVLWPIYGGDGQLVSWTARSIENHPLKYKTADNSDASKTFWPYIKPKGDEVIIVEGMLDAIAVRRYFPNVYATFGKKISNAQIELLQSWDVNTVTLFWDRKDAKPEMKKTAQFLETRFADVFLADVRNWPTKSDGTFYDTGDSLRHPDAVVPAIQQAITGRIKRDSVTFLSWELDS